MLLDPFKYPQETKNRVTVASLASRDMECHFGGKVKEGRRRELSFSSADLRYLLPNLLYYREKCPVKVFL